MPRHIRSAKHLLQSGYRMLLLDLVSNGLGPAAIREYLVEREDLDVSEYIVKAAISQFGDLNQLFSLADKRNAQELYEEACEAMERFKADYDAAIATGDKSTARLCAQMWHQWWRAKGQFFFGPAATNINIIGQQNNQTTVNTAVQAFLQLDEVKQNPELAQKYLEQLRAKQQGVN